MVGMVGSYGFIQVFHSKAAKCRYASRILIISSVRARPVSRASTITALKVPLPTRRPMSCSDQMHVIDGHDEKRANQADHKNIRKCSTLFDSHILFACTFPRPSFLCPRFQVSHTHSLCAHPRFALPRYSSTLLLFIALLYYAHTFTRDAHSTSVQFFSHTQPKVSALNERNKVKQTFTHTRASGSEQKKNSTKTCCRSWCTVTTRALSVSLARCALRRVQWC